MDVEQVRIPKHIGIIPDGNRTQGRKSNNIIVTISNLCLNQNNSK